MLNLNLTIHGPPSRYVQTCSLCCPDCRQESGCRSTQNPSCIVCSHILLADPPLGPISFIFMQFLGKLLSDYRLRHLSQNLAWEIYDPSLHRLQSRIQDFSEVGGTNPPGERGCQHTILPNFPKNCMKLEEFGLGGASLAPPEIHHCVCVIVVLGKTSQETTTARLLCPSYMSC